MELAWPAFMHSGAGKHRRHCATPWLSQRFVDSPKTYMPGTEPGMTDENCDSGQTGCDPAKPHICTSISFGPGVRLALESSL